MVSFGLLGQIVSGLVYIDVHSTFKFDAVGCMSCILRFLINGLNGILISAFNLRIQDKKLML